MVTATAREELFGEADGEIYWELATIEHASLAQPIRVVNAREEGFVLSSRGQDFLAYPFFLTWPAQDPGQPFGGARLVINNVVAQDGLNEPVALASLRGLTGQARVRFELVRRSTPDVPENRTTRLRLSGINYDATTISGALDLPNFGRRAAGYSFTSDRYRNLRPQ